MKFTKKENGNYKTQTEIKEAMRKVLGELKTLQSMGTYDREQIESLNARRRALQSMCDHTNQQTITFDNEEVRICSDCQLILY